MRANRLSKLAVAASAAVVLAVQAMGQTGTAPAAATKATPVVERTIVVSLEDRRLALVENGKVQKVYTVAVGKPSTPSPVGKFTIERRVKNPIYHHGDKTVQAGPGNPVGTRWMGLSIKGYGIHGTNEPKSIGRAASHGCVRMGKADIEDLFDRVSVGDSVEFIGHRNEETAALFGGEQKPAAAEQPVVTASVAAVPMPASTTEGVGVSGDN